MPSLSEGTIGVLDTILGILASIWWIILPVFLLFLLLALWRSYKKSEYLAGLEWVLLQIIIPQDNSKTPLAMEQVFASLHSVLGQGLVQDSFSLELRSAGGQISIYVRTLSKHRNLVESSIYAQFPEVEIEEVDDYTFSVSSDLPSDQYDLTGAEFILSKEDAYPIRTYEFFQFEIDEDKRTSNVDPVAGLIEALSRLGDNEQFWMQIAIEPTGDAWKKEGEKLISELMGEKKEEKGKSVLFEIISKEAKDYATGISQAPFRVPDFTEGEKKEEKKEASTKQMSPGKRGAIEAVEKNISKVGFKTTIRSLYIAPKEIFDTGMFQAAIASLNQFNTQDLNSFKSNKKVAPSAKRLFKDAKIRKKKRALLSNYRNRAKSKDQFVLSTEELATIFHFPSKSITAPTLPRIETRKGEPPSGLPSYP